MLSLDKLMDLKAIRASFAQIFSIAQPREFHFVAFHPIN